MNTRKTSDFSSKNKTSNVVPIRSNNQYDETRIITKKILCIGNALKKDISKLIKLSSNENPNSQTIEFIKKNKIKILNRLEGLSRIRDNTKIENEEQWRQILHNALLHVYKHSTDNEMYQSNIDIFTSIQAPNMYQYQIPNEEYEQDINRLVRIDEDDVSETGIYFLQEYMRIVARIPRDQIFSPFKP